MGIESGAGPSRASRSWVAFALRGLAVLCLLPIGASCGHSCKTSADCPSQQECLPLDTDPQSLTCCAATSQEGGSCCTQNCAGSPCGGSCTGGQVCLAGQVGGMPDTCCDNSSNCGGVCCFGPCVNGACQN